MQNTNTYHYRAPFPSARLRYVWAVTPLLLLTLASVLHWSENRPLEMDDVPLMALLLWPAILIWTGAQLRAARQGDAGEGQTIPVEPPLTVSPVALAAGDPAQTTVHFRNGTFVPAGQRDERAAIAFATERLAAPRDLRDFRVTSADGGGRLVAFDDVTVWLSPDEIKHSGTIDLGRQAAAKISLDARTPEPIRVRAAQ